MIAMPRVALFLLLALSLEGSEFYSGQAARAVLGQPSFSSKEAGVTASAMFLSNSRLYVADPASRVLTFDLTRLPGPKDELPSRAGSLCPLCGLPPFTSVPQRVASGSTVSIHGKTLAAIDTRGRRVLIWRDITLASAAHGPDIVLQSSDLQTAVVSESTLVDPISVAFDGMHLFVGDAALRRVLVWRSLPSVNNQSADAVLGQRDFGAHELADVPRADTISRPESLVSDGTNLFVGDSIDRRILVFSPADLRLTADAVVNSASLSAGPLAPGTLVTVMGNTLADKTSAAPDDGSETLPTKLAGVQVLFNGLPLPLIAVSPAEIRTQLPYAPVSFTSANLYLRIERNDGTVAITTPVTVSLTAASPALFAFGGKEPRPGILLHSDASDGLDGAPVTSDDPAVPGEAVTVWTTGLELAGVAPEQAPVAGVPYTGTDLIFAPVRASVNGEPAEVQSVTYPRTSIGVYQIRIVLPPGIAQDSSAQLTITQDSVSSNVITVPVKRSSTR
jgi:uncharacterized protein (TIGR03437 family)